MAPADASPGPGCLRNGTAHSQEEPSSEEQASDADGPAMGTDPGEDAVESGNPTRHFWIGNLSTHISRAVLKTVFDKCVLRMGGGKGARAGCCLLRKGLRLACAGLVAPPPSLNPPSPHAIPLSRFGVVDDVVTFPGRMYAFVNFRTTEEAVAAMDTLQGLVVRLGWKRRGADPCAMPRLQAPGSSWESPLSPVAS